MFEQIPLLSDMPLKPVEKPVYGMDILLNFE